MTCTITSRGFELLLALQIAPPERFPKNALSILKCNLLEILCALVEKGYTDFYVNGAYGIPFWSAEMICALKLYHPALRLHLVQPYPEHNAGWKPELRERFQQILEKADEVFCAEPEETADGRPHHVQRQRSACDIRDEKCKPEHGLLCRDAGRAGVFAEMGEPFDSVMKKAAAEIRQLFCVWVSPAWTGTFS